MKILSTEQIREADAYTISHEPVRSTDLMERAGRSCFEWIRKRFSDKKKSFSIFCGTGNNGGDGLVIARLLHNDTYHVHVFVTGDISNAAPDFQINHDRLKSQGIIPQRIHSGEDIPSFKKDEVIVDALFGTGLSRPVTGIAEGVIQAINGSGCDVISIDIPSGLKGDSFTDDKKEAIVKATHTLTFQFPKLSFLLPETGIYAGNWEILDIHLHPDFIKTVPARNFFITSQEIKEIYHARKKFSHKGTYGHALIVAGSYGKMGAAVLATRACLHSGAGLATAHIPRCGYEIIQTSVPEAMVTLSDEEEIISGRVNTEPYSAIAAGPGIGKEEQTQNMLKGLIQNSANALVLDADALNILSENKTWLHFLPKGSILTPHPKEFERLFGKTSDCFERLQVLRDAAFKYGIYIILKDAHTAVACPDGSCYFNSTGNPGMATGGSGDALTGVLAGLLAQGYIPWQASLMGVYLHGLAGDLAALRESEEAMTAGTIIASLGKAFLSLRNIRPSS